MLFCDCFSRSKQQVGHFPFTHVEFIDSENADDGIDSWNHQRQMKIEEEEDAVSVGAWPSPHFTIMFLIWWTMKRYQKEGKRM